MARRIPDQAGLEAMPAEERKFAFQTQPVWKRAADGGCRAVCQCAFDNRDFRSVFRAFTGKVITNPVVSKTMPGSPAEIAGFLPGDKFVSIDGNADRIHFPICSATSRRAPIRK